MRKLTRTQRRAYMHKQPDIKLIRKAHFFNIEKLELMHAFKESGAKMFNEHFEATQRSVVDQLAKSESIILEKLKALNLSQEAIDNYINIWADLNMWPRSKNASNKKLRTLNRELGIC